MINTYQDFLLAQKFLSKYFDGALCTNVTKEAEGKEYGAYQFNIGHQHIAFRSAKTTPTKVGQFVTFWKRSSSGPIAPFDLSDAIDFFIISVRYDHKFGLFIFPQLVLLEQGIISKNHIGGKRALRVYPIWDKANNKQAIETQAWQLKYFHEIEF